MTIRIVLADDHAMVREGLVLILEKSRDIEVVGVAADGRAAVQMARELRPDVVVLDLAMPEMTGLEACRQMRRDLPGTKAIILSMHAAPEYVYQALRAGATGYVIKAATGTELVDAILAAHAGRRFLSRRVAENVVDEYISRGGAAADEDPFERLSAREMEVLRLVVTGESSREIAGLLHVSASTVDTYRSRIKRKLGLPSFAALVKFAIEHGITSLP